MGLSVACVCSLFSEMWSDCLAAMHKTKLSNAFVRVSVHAGSQASRQKGSQLKLGLKFTNTVANSLGVEDTN